MWFSNELKNFLGSFSPTGELGWIGEKSRVSKHGFVLDTLVAETATTGGIGKHFLQTKLGNYPNRPTMLAVKSDLGGVGNYGTLAMCSIPGDASEPIELIQNTIKWMPATRLGRIDQFGISIETDQDQLLPFRGGTILIVIRIQNAVYH